MSESPDGSEILRICLGGTSRCAGDVKGPGHGTDVSTGQADGLRGWTDTLDVSNSAGMDGMSDGEGAGTYLGARGTKRVVHTTDGVGSQSDASSGHWDVPSVGMDVITAANMPEIISIP